MSERLDNLKKMLKEEKDNEKMISKLLEVMEEMENEISNLTDRCDEMEEELEAVNEDINLINDGMHIEDYEDEISAVCPYCHEEINIKVEDIEDMDEITCPHCDKEITLDWGDDCDCGCCDHGCCDDCEDEE